MIRTGLSKRLNLLLFLRIGREVGVKHIIDKAYHSARCAERVTLGVDSHNIRLAHLETLECEVAE